VNSQAGQVILLRLRDAVDGAGASVYLTAGGKLGISAGVAGSPATVANSSVAPGVGWHTVELRLVPGAAGIVQVWLDDTLVPALNLTPDLSVVGSITYLQVGDTASSAGGWDLSFDDAAFSTTRIGAQVDTVAPSTPTLSASAASAFSADLSWTAATDDTGIGGYDVTRDGTVVASLPAGTTSWSDMSVTPSTSYTYAVRARDLAGNASEYSAPAPVTTPAAATPLFADGFESGITAWSASGAVTLQGTTVHGGAEALQVAENGVGSAASYVRKDLPSSYPDAYARVWVNAASSSSQVALIRLRDSAGIALGYVFLSPLGFLGYNNAAGTSVTSTVALPTGWHSVEVRRLAGTAGLVRVWLDDVPVAGLSLTTVDTGANGVAQFEIGEKATGQTFSIALDDAAFSNDRIGAVADTAAPTVPATTATATSAFGVDVSWTASTDASGVAGYDVARDGTLVATVGAGTTVWSDSTALASTSYTYSVRARDLVGNVSAWSDAPVTTPAAATPLLADGFESGAFGSWTAGAKGAAMTISTSPVFAGTYAARAVATVGGSGTSLRATLPSGPYADAYARVRVQVSSLSAAATLIRFRESAAGTIVGSLTLTAAGSLQFSGGIGVATKTGPALAAGWHTLELHVVSSGSVSGYEVWLDGVAVPGMSATGATTGVGSMAVLQIGDLTAPAAGGYDISFDDVAFSTSRIGLQ